MPFPLAEFLHGVKQTVAKRLTLLRRSSRYISPPNPISIALKILESQQDLAIVQLGAYIGDSDNDPLFSFLAAQQHPSLTAVLVEPSKPSFDILQKNYCGASGVYLENVAVAEHSGLAEFYRLSVDPVKFGFPEWLSQLSSLKEERMGEIWQRYEADPAVQKFYLQHRIKEQVQCMTFSDILSAYRLQKVDLLQMDVEGYEWEILNTIDLETAKIRFINYESVLLLDNKSSCESYLRNRGYVLADHGKDTFACRKEDLPLFGDLRLPFR
jgi:FkbM family methyltransferase